MKRFNITVNGKTYDVAVEEQGEGASVSVPAPAPAVQAAPRAPKQAAVEPETPKASEPASEGEKIMAPMPGTIVDVMVSSGASVTSGQVLVVLEAMKMENEIVSPKDGQVTSVTAKKGDTVNADDVLLTIV